MIRYLILILFLFGCTDEQPTDIADTPSPYDRFYWIMQEPDWPEGTLEGVYSQTPNGNGYTLTPDSLFWDSRFSYPVRIKRNGAEIWLRTPGNHDTFRGVVGSESIDGYVIREQINGRPGPIEFIILRRVQ